MMIMFLYCPVGFFSFSVFAPKLLIVILWHGLHGLHGCIEFQMYWTCMFTGGKEETDITNFFLKG